MSTRSKGSTAWKVLISLGLIVVVLAIVAEFGARWYISDSMKKELAQESGMSADGASITFGPTPILASIFTRKVPSVNINTPSTVRIEEGNPPTISGNPASQLEISQLNIADQNNPVAGHLVVHSQLPEDFLLAQIQASMAQQTANSGNDLASQLMSNLVRVTGIHANPDTGNLEVEFVDGAAKLDLHPRAEGGKVRFDAQGAELLGFKLPKQATDAISKTLEDQAADVGGNLSVDEFTVGDGQLNVTFSGDNVPLNDVQGTGEPGSAATKDAVKGDRA